ncbi:hypothetical protein HanIR_Chr15g0762591 [Helianthus annuus]|nr:hypothetical protein HanIR_Chr15g0762591 [Helianthus annuus]
MVYVKIPPDLCLWNGPKVQESCCINRKRQHAGHGPVSAGHGPVCRQNPDTFCPYSDQKSDGNLLVNTDAC